MEKYISKDLANKVHLVGFSDESESTMVVVKKNVSNYVKKAADGAKNLDNVAVSCKKVHAHEDGKGGKYEVHVKLNDGGKIYTASAVDFNLFVAIDDVFTKLNHELKID